jgi:enoyl-CoA hydratase/carnithine racemase
LSTSSFTPRDCLLYEVKDRKAYVTLNRPEAMNALNTDLREAVHDAFVAATADDDVLVVILRGAGGRAFSAGADLKELSGRQSAEPRGPQTRSSRPQVARKGYMAGWDDIDTCPKPVIAAIDGHCLAGGFEMAIYCDIRVATRKSTFGLPEPKRSLLAGPGLINLSRMVPLGTALRMQLTGSAISAERAYEVQLIQDLAEDRDDLDAKVEALADELLECAPLAVQFIKRIVRDGHSMTVDEAWRFSEMYSQILSETEDALEGPRAFTEKRKPSWKMR